MKRIILICTLLVVGMMGVPALPADDAFQPVDPQTLQALRVDNIPSTVSLHPLYQRAGSAKSVPDLTLAPPKMSEPLPRDWPPEANQENTQNLIEHWENRMPVEDYQRLIDQAMATARDSRPLGPGTVWRQEVLGIQESDGIHHKAGRARAAAYAYDNDQDGTVLWVAGSSGGLWKAVVVGFFAFWVPVSDTLPGSPGVGAFLVKPGDSNYILIGTGDSYRYSGNGMYRTEDGGATWSLTSLAPIPGAFYRIVADKADPDANTVLACGDYGIWRSTDFGGTWTRVYAVGTSDLVQDPVNRQYWYAGGPGSGVLESLDGGLTFFQRSGSGITAPIGRVSVTLCDAAPNYIYALVEGSFGALGGIYRSSNYGVNYTKIDTIDAISWGQAFHANAIAVDPTNPNRLFAAMGGIQRTDNATAGTPCWYRNGTGSCTACNSACIDGGHADFTGILFQPGTTNVIMTNDGGYYVYEYTANTLNGTGNLLGLALEQTMQVGAMAGSRSQPNLLLSGLQDNGMVRINKTATPRIQSLGGGDGGQASISPSNSDHFFFSSGVAYNRFYSTNQGGSWNNVNCTLPNEWAPSMQIDPTPGLSSPRLFTHSVPYVYYKIVSSACDWARANNGNPLPGDFPVKQVDVSNDIRYVLYVSGWASGSLYVMDGYVHGSLGSMSWADRTPPLPAGSTRNDAWINSDRSVLQPGTVYYTTGGARPSRAFMSTDRGLAWTDVTGDLVTLLPNAHYRKLVGNPSNLDELYLATNVGVFRSDNGGVNWYNYSDGLPAVVDVIDLDLNFDVAYPPLLHIGTYGRGFWERPLF